MTTPPLISVVVVTWNGVAVLPRCLAQLGAQTHPRVQTIVVDNGSTDGGAELAAQAAAEGRLELVRSDGNRGVAAGRNLGVAHARGEYVAFIDDDGYAHPRWLATAADALAADPTLGAVAPLVFFDDHRLILNGAGGTLNYRAYAADWGWEAPFEFADLPAEVLYPMGCGMVARRTALEAIGPLDEALVNYYDDAELGIRLWARGFRVAVCRSAWVDHGGGGARNRPGQRGLVLGERHRVRTALKYFPACHLPLWLLHELRLAAHLRHPQRRQVPFDAWWWNLRHFGSAWPIRRRFAGTAVRWWPLLQPTWRLGAAAPPNRTLHPDPAAAGPALTCDGTADAARLNFGWYPVARDGARPFRPSAAVASALFAFDRGVTQCMLAWRGAHAVDRVELSLRPFGELAPTWRHVAAPPPAAWEQRRLPCPAPPGRYELLLRTEPAHHDAHGREHGLDVAAIAFTATA